MAPKESGQPAKRARKSTEKEEANGHTCLVERPPVCPLDLGWVKSARVNSSAVGRRAAEIGTRRTVKKDWQAAWELRAITCARPPAPHAPSPPLPPKASWSPQALI